MVIDHAQLDAVGSPPPAGDSEELIVTGGIDDVVKIWRYRFPLQNLVDPIQSKETFLSPLTPLLSETGG